MIDIRLFCDTKGKYFEISSENWNNEIYFHIDFEIDLTKTFVSGSELTVTIRD